MKGKYKKHDDIAVDPDESIYCLCDQISHREMIVCCDNDMSNWMVLFFLFHYQQNQKLNGFAPSVVDIFQI